MPTEQAGHLAPPGMTPREAPQLCPRRGPPASLRRLVLAGRPLCRRNGPDVPSRGSGCAGAMAAAAARGVSLLIAQIANPSHISVSHASGLPFYRRGNRAQCAHPAPWDLTSNSVTVLSYIFKFSSLRASLEKWPFEIGMSSGRQMSGCRHPVASGVTSHHCGASVEFHQSMGRSILMRHLHIQVREDGLYHPMLGPCRKGAPFK